MTNCFGTAPDQITGRPHERCMELLGVFEMECRSPHGFHSSTWVFECLHSYILYCQRLCALVPEKKSLIVVYVTRIAERED